MAPRIRENILKISPYKAGESKVEGVAKVIKLSSNENTAGPSPHAIEAYRAAADRMAFYPDPIPLGKSLGKLARHRLDGELPLGIQPLSDLRKAMNYRFVRHLGLTVDRDEFDLVFPQR